jgi:hypothetical protein
MENEKFLDLNNIFGLNTLNNENKVNVTNNVFHKVIITKILE